MSSRWIPLTAAAAAIVAAIVFTFSFPVRAAERPTTAAPATAQAPPSASGPIEPEDALARMSLVLAVLGGAGGLLVWVVRKAKRLPTGRGRGRSLELVEVISIGSKRSIAVARVYDRYFVLGIGDGPLTLLTELRNEETEMLENGGRAPAGYRAATGAETFKALLSRMTRKGAVPAASSSGAETDTETPAEERAHATLAPSVRRAPAAPAASTAATPASTRRRPVAFTGVTRASDRVASVVPADAPQGGFEELL